MPNSSWPFSSRSGSGVLAWLTRSGTLVLKYRADPYQKSLSFTNGPPRLRAGFRYSDWAAPKAGSSGLDAKLFGRYSMRAAPATLFVPDLLTAFVTNPAARPNSAVIAPRLMLNSAMSSSFTSVER